MGGGGYNGGRIENAEGGRYLGQLIKNSQIVGGGVNHLETGGMGWMMGRMRVRMKVKEGYGDGTE